MITLIDVTKSYKVGATRKIVIQNVTITLPRGRSVGLLGRNGAGKSTLLNMIGGRLEPDSGTIRRAANISWPLGFGGGFQGSLTGAQNARFIARIYGVDTDDMIAAVEDFAELGAFMHMRVATYSSGMRARLAFGVSMAIDFDVYLVDEITAVGDAAFKRKCTAAFRERAEKADIIMVSHNTGAIRNFCDAGIVLENGTMTWYDDVEEAIAVHDANMQQRLKPA
jgi:capsular polysaccharide transport system ATP-binding protein